MLKLANLRVAVPDARSLTEIVARRLRIDSSNIKKVSILRKAVDARRKDDIRFVYTLAIEVADEVSLLKKSAANRDISLLQEDKPLDGIVYGDKPLVGRPVVAGAGPAGLIAAFLLAEHGYRPLLIERGRPAAERALAVSDFWKNGKLSPDNNVQFGEGGAGAFSDGKLTTRVNDPAGRLVLEWFVEAGAPEEILYEYKPHVGTDRLRNMVGGLTDRIRKNGGEVLFSSKLTDLGLVDGTLGEISVNSERLECNALILATGHSARDTYNMLQGEGFALAGKPFSIGLRIEHPQEIIDRAQYGLFAGHEKLGPADYALVYHDRASGRSAYSFCMCPGGVVIAATSGERQVVTNGMSLYKRDSGRANSALAVGVGPEDFGGQPLDGMKFQEYWENLAFEKAGKDYCAPAQNVGSFLQGGSPVLGALNPTYAPGVRAVELREVLPAFVIDTLAKALPDFGRKIKGFDQTDALLTGVETRTSSPVRILRSPDSRQAVGWPGVYPAGEGAGYAGGIMSAAIDGYHAAAALMKEYKRLL